MGAFFLFVFAIGLGVFAWIRMDTIQMSGDFEERPPEQGRLNQQN
ncbi:MAG TPA: hypothetical protein VKA68_13200 [bacterium]|nr:hypothetical protein [bacterium]